MVFARTFSALSDRFGIYRCVARQYFNTRHARRSDTCNLCCIFTTASRRRAGLRSFPRRLPLRWPCPGINLRRATSDGHFPIPSSSGVSLGPPESRHSPVSTDSRSAHRSPTFDRRLGPTPPCRIQSQRCVNVQ